MFFAYRDKGPFQRRGGTFSVVECADEEAYKAALDGGCVSHPDLIGKEPEEVNDDTAPATKQEMIQHLKSLGVEVDKRWGEDRLKQEIEKAKT